MINLMLGTIQFASISIIAFLEYKARSLSLFLWDYFAYNVWLSSLICNTVRYFGIR